MNGAIGNSGDARRECLVFLAHGTGVGAMTALQQLREQCGARFTVVPLFDHTKSAFPIDHIPGALSVTCAAVTRELPYRVKHKQHKGTFWPRNIDLPLLWFFQQQPQYEYYWLMEYDVRFTGDWREFFGHFAGNSCDLLATTVFDYDFRPGWDHWKTLTSPREVPLSERVRALFPLCRLSNRALQAVHAAYCEGWSGHYEVAIPTILKTCGFSIEDIGGDGAYVATENRNRFYRNSPGIAGLAPGTFTVTANAIAEGYPRNMLWHPIKG